MHQVAKGEEVGKIYRTNNFGIFIIDSKNRKVDESHVRKIMKQIQRTNLLEARPITVDKNMTVVDGQHRLEAAKRLNLPIYYQVSNIKIEEAPIINCQQKNWDSKDFLYSYAEMGDENYIRLIELSKETAMNPNLLLKLISNERGGSKAYTMFRAGLFEMDADSTYNIKKILLLIRNIIEKVKSHPGHSVNSKIISSNRGIDSLFSFLNNILPVQHHDLFARKMYDYAARLYKCASIKEYHEMYMAIYKYHNSRALV